MQTEPTEFKSCKKHLIVDLVMLANSPFHNDYKLFFVTEETKL